MSSNKKKKQKKYFSEPESDEYFAFIAGYTSGGFPYGITWEEMEKIEKDERVRRFIKLNDDEKEDLPFD